MREYVAARFHHESISNEWVGRGGADIWQHYECALRQIGPRETLLDAGCGCGVLGIMAALRGYATKIVMCDLDPQSVAFAKRNCEMYGVDAEIIEADLCDIEGAFDLVIGNLPRNVMETPRGLNPLRFWYPDGVMFELLLGRMSALLKPHGFLIVNDNCTVRTFPGLRDTLVPRGDFKTVQADMVSTTGFITGLPVMPMFEADQCLRVVEYLG